MKEERGYKWNDYLVSDDEQDKNFWWHLPLAGIKEDEGEDEEGISPLYHAAKIDDDSIGELYGLAHGRVWIKDGIITAGPWKVMDGLDQESLDDWKEKYDKATDFVKMLESEGIEIKLQREIMDIGPPRVIKNDENS